MDNFSNETNVHIKRQDKKIEMLGFIALAVFALLLCVWNIEDYGDIFRFMLIPLIIFLGITKCYIPLKNLLLTCAIVLGIAFSCKLGFAYLASHYVDSQSLMSFVQIAKRPINGEFKGFPSGHTTAAFIAVAFAWIYYDVKWKILFFILAALVGYSRIHSLWHTPTQVIVGALLGLGLGVALLWILKNHSFFLTKLTKKDYNPSP